MHFNYPCLYTRKFMLLCSHRLRQSGKAWTCSVFEGRHVPCPPLASGFNSVLPWQALLSVSWMTAKQTVSKVRPWKMKWLVQDHIGSWWQRQNLETRRDHPWSTILRTSWTLADHSPPLLKPWKYSTLLPQDTPLETTLAQNGQTQTYMSSML